MSYVINPGHPEKLALSEFIRPGHKIGEFIMPGIPELKVKKIRPTGEGRPFEEFRIHLGRYHLDPERNAMYVASQIGPVVAMLDGELVGGVTALSLWVHPAFRKKNLAIEMTIDHMRYIGVEAWSKFYRQREAVGVVMRYTAAGLETLKAAHAEMVRRGILLDEPSGL
jgi:hypothetical protein